MRERQFEMIETDGATLRVVVEGEGPLVILLHGWPQCWYLWRHQIDPLVDAGYRVAVPDQRGYGGSSCPPEVSDYSILKLTADVDAIRAALGYDTFRLIGHDWGCVVAWNTALLYEQTCAAVMGLSVPFWRISEDALNPPGFDDRFWYIRYFQQADVVERELDADIERSLRVNFYGLGGDSPPGTWMTQLEHPASAGLLEALPEPGKVGPGTTDEDLAYYVEQFSRHGFAGPTNWYRNMPTNNALTAELEGKRITQPAAFAAGADDDVLLYDPDWREPFEAGFRNLRFLEILDGAAHWLQVEKPAETTALMLRFLREVS
ncbi:MAG: alpha/beta fold hydrolase [Gammaproteobacteria bacterium]